jgi:tRNA-splicing ligase RtcB (3'-phosphate/5'-hydroxy nucleic acid ligase)
MKNKFNRKTLINLGLHDNKTISIALGIIHRYKKKSSFDVVCAEILNVIKTPEEFISDSPWNKLAQCFLNKPIQEECTLLEQAAPFQIFGESEIDAQTIAQMYNALKLPVAEKGALMPDAHLGYGLPIGGVLACKNAIIPYAVGVDIGCRMSLSIFDANSSYFRGKDNLLKKILSTHTKFGLTETHEKINEHEVLDNPLFNEIPILKSLKNKAYKQLGSSGGGNHFVEFGVVELLDNSLELHPGKYFALLSHSGSRGLGSNIAEHYSRLATELCHLPKAVKHLSWLNTHHESGIEYWLAMNLAGEYAKACHDDIHNRIAKTLGLKNQLKIENHHNFAWKEMIDGNECIVHRKGATPAGKGVLGIIPGSMSQEGYIVRGLGNADSIYSASHGAGRLLSRSKCKSMIGKNDMMKDLKSNGIELIGGGIDESPQAYKDLRRVMSQQQELIETIGKFSPKIVRMN